MWGYARLKAGQLPELMRFFLWPLGEGVVEDKRPQLFEHDNVTRACVIGGLDQFGLQLMIALILKFLGFLKTSKGG